MPIIILNGTQQTSMGRSISSVLGNLTAPMWDMNLCSCFSSSSPLFSSSSLPHILLITLSLYRLEKLFLFGSHMYWSHSILHSSCLAKYDSVFRIGSISNIFPLFYLLFDSWRVCQIWSNLWLFHFFFPICILSTSAVFLPYSPRCCLSSSNLRHDLSSFQCKKYTDTIHWNTAPL